MIFILEDHRSFCNLLRVDYIMFYEIAKNKNNLLIEYKKKNIL